MSHSPKHPCSTYITIDDVALIDAPVVYTMAPYCSPTTPNSDLVLLATPSSSFLIIAHAHALAQSTWFAPRLKGVQGRYVGIWITDDMLYKQLTPSIHVSITPQVFATAIRSLYTGPNPELDGDRFDYDPNEGDIVNFTYTCRLFGIPPKCSLLWEDDAHTGMLMLNDMWEPKPSELLQVAEMLTPSSSSPSMDTKHRHEWIDAATTVIEQTNVKRSELLGLSQMLRPDTLAYIVSISLASFQ